MYCTTLAATCLLTIVSWAPTPENLPPDGGAAAGGYCVVVAEATRADPEWKPVVEALVTKHRASVLTYARSVEETLARLRDQPARCPPSVGARSPRYVCFVAKPAEVSREFVAQVHRLTRRLDDDPYTDALWGILTGYDAANALRIARHKEPLIIRRVAAGTEVELSVCEEGVWYCELNQGKMVRKQPGGKPEQLRARPTRPRPWSMP